MGRVARYKKVKKSLSKATPKGGERLSITGNSSVKNVNSGSDYFDTVGVWGLVDSGRKPKKRSRTSVRLRAQRNKKGACVDNNIDCFDLACTDGDDFDMNDPVGTLTKQSIKTEATSPAVKSSTAVTPLLLSQASTTSSAQQNSSVQNPTVMVPKIDVEEEKLHKKLETQVLPKAPVVASEGRMPGESKRAYNKRVKKETRQIIQRANQMDRNPEKRQKKKDFLTQKKKSGRKRKNPGGYSENDEDYSFDDDGDRSKVLTGEQAVAARDRATRVQFGEQADRPPIFKELPRGATKIKKQKILRAGLEEIEEERRAMELMRIKLQAQYATVKARRKLNGEFHL